MADSDSDDDVSSVPHIAAVASLKRKHADGDDDDDSAHAGHHRHGATGAGSRARGGRARGVGRGASLGAPRTFNRNFGAASKFLRHDNIESAYVGATSSPCWSAVCSGLMMHVFPCVV